MKNSALVSNSAALVLILLVGNAFADEVNSPGQELQPPTHKLHLSAVGGMNLSTTTQSDATQTIYQSVGVSQSSGIGYAAGVLAAFSLSPNLDLETGLLYAHHSVTTTDVLVSGSLSSVYNNVQVPVVARFNFAQFLGLGGGVYYAHGVGNVGVNSSIAGIPNSSFSYSDSYTRQDDFGLVFNARGTVPVANGTSVFLDARYLLGLLNENTDGNPADNYSFREFQLLAGLSFGI